MRPHHQATIQRMTEYVRQDPQFLALIVGGSIVKDLARDDSDVDVVLLATDAAYEDREARQDLFYFDQSMCDYENGYVDGKVVNYAYLQDAAERGSEPTRWAFLKAFVAYSEVPDLQTLLDSIAVYPKDQQAARMRAFYSQVLMLNWFMGEAEKRNQRYLLLQSATDMVLFAGRLFLAYNEILFPSHKWFMNSLAQVPNKPDDLLPLCDQLLDAPNKETAQALFDCVNDYRDWGIPFNEALTQFTTDFERRWREGRSALRNC